MYRYPEKYCYLLEYPCREFSILGITYLDATIAYQANQPYQNAYHFFHFAVCNIEIYI